MRPRHHLDCGGLRGVTSHGAQLMGVGAHHVGQDMSVRGVALGAGHTMPPAVLGCLQRVDRIHGVPGGDQRGHPRALVSLGPDHHLARTAAVRVIAECLTGHGVQPGHPGHAFGQPGLRQPTARGVHQLDVVMILGPVVPNEQSQRCSRLAIRTVPAACGRTISALMTQCSRRIRTGTTSHQRSTLPASRQGHGLSTGLPGRDPRGASAHLPAATGASLPDGRPANSH